MDPHLGKPLGPKFSSYRGLIARKHVFIVIPSWVEVEETEKNLIW